MPPSGTGNHCIWRVADEVGSKACQKDWPPLIQHLSQKQELFFRPSSIDKLKLIVEIPLPSPPNIHVTGKKDNATKTVTARKPSCSEQICT